MKNKMKMLTKRSLSFVSIVTANVTTKILFLLFALMATTSHSQTISSFLTPEGSYDFTSDLDVQLRADSIFITYKDSFGLGANDTMRIVDSATVNAYNGDELTVLKYQQYYKGYEVEKAGYNVQALDMTTRIMEGKIISGLNISVTGGDLATEAEALEEALEYINADEYAWEDEQYQIGLQISTGNPNATYYPDGTLLIARVSDDPNETTANYTFAWKFEIVAIDPHQSYTMYVDARTRDVSAGCWSPFTPAPEINNYELQPSLSDEFNYGNGSYQDLNGNKWSVDQNRCDDESYSQHQNISFLNNVYVGPPTTNYSDIMRITAKREQSEVHVYYCPTWDTIPDSSRVRNYSAAIIQTNEDYLYGYFEIRCKFPGLSREVSQDFWFYEGFCIDHNWPMNTSSEVDVFEHFPTTSTQGDSAARHYPTNFHHGPCETGCGSDYLCYTSPYDYNTCLDLFTQFHTYSIAWTPASITFYMDGHAIPAIPSAQNGNSNIHQVVQMYRQCSDSVAPACSLQYIGLNDLVAMHAIIGQSVRNAANPPAQNEILNFDIDYFRYYKRKPDITGPSCALPGNDETFTASMYGGANTTDTYSWSVTAGGTINGSSTGSSVSIHMNTGYPYVDITATATETTPGYVNSVTGLFSYNTARVSSRTLRVYLTTISGTVVQLSQIGNTCARQAIVAEQPGAEEYEFSDNGGSSWVLGTRTPYMHPIFNTITSYYWRHGAYTNISVPFTVMARSHNCAGYGTAASVSMSTWTNPLYCMRLDNSSRPDDPQFQLYPNPANNELTVNYFLSKDEKAILEIMSIAGSVISEYELDPHNTSITISTSELEGGIYLCRIYGRDVEREVQKLVIIK